MFLCCLLCFFFFFWFTWSKTENCKTKLGTEEEWKHTCNHVTEADVSRWITLARLLAAHPAALSLPLLNTTKIQNKVKKLTGGDRLTDFEDTYQLPSWVKQSHLGKIDLLTTKNGWWETKMKNKISPHPFYFFILFYFFRLNPLLHSRLLHLLPPEKARNGEWGSWSVPIHSSLLVLHITLFPPQAGPLSGLQSPAISTMVSPQASQESRPQCLEHLLLL